METVLLELPHKNGIAIRGILRSSRLSLQRCVLLLAGFQRSAAASYKLKSIADRLAAKSIPSIRLDYTGYGLSDGIPEDITFSQMVADALSAILYLREHGVNTVDVVAHSIGTIVVASLFITDPAMFRRIVLLAPGLNIKDLVRYHMVRKFHPNKKSLTWFEAMNMPDITTSAIQLVGSEIQLRDGTIKKSFLLELLDKDFSQAFDGYEDRIFHIYGEKDALVPPESLQKVFPNRLALKNGDHELEQGRVLRQWLESCIEFLL